MIELVSLSGPAARVYSEALAQLRIQVFAEWPYLYHGSLEYERKYIKTFLKARHSVLVLALDNGQVVGASTGLPMLRETANIKRPFMARGHDLSRIFYFSESVLLPAYRGQGIGLRFFEARERWSIQHGFEQAVFCAVIRPLEHPLRPVHYIPLDAFWEKRGFQKMEDYTCQIAWQDHDETEETPKTLAFWGKWLTIREGAGTGSI
jgi:GNAT superfamily N-acetyltransferase